MEEKTFFDAGNVSVTNGGAMEKAKRKLQEVFVLSGPPEYTFVEPVEYTGLLVGLQTDGRSIVIEGPSGIGKTTSIEKAIAQAGLQHRVLKLSARKTEDAAFIADLANNLPLGTVLIDDFHRLDDTAKKLVADLMKTLADEGASHSKLIVLGIPNVGQSLIAFGKDLANRIEVIRFEANPEHKVHELLEKGEVELNIELNIKDEIVDASQGSFYIAQMLAYDTCIRGGILEASDTRRTTTESYEAVKAVVMGRLARTFHDTAVTFSRGTKLRREGRAPYLHLLHWLSQSKNWAINADREADKHPEQRGSVSQVVSKGFLSDLIQSSEDLQRVLHFDARNSMLIAQDPQFVFYLRNISWQRLADDVGFLSLDFPSRYDFALSFAGSDRGIAQALFDRLENDELEVFYDANEQHRILAADVEEYLAPIYASEAQMVICILGPDYPKKIWTKFESQQFRQRFGAGDVVPIVLNNTQVGAFDEAGRVGHIAWDVNADLDEQANLVVNALKRKCAELRKARRELADKEMQRD
jgi:hypothetical protein